MEGRAARRGRKPVLSLVEGRGWATSVSNALKRVPGGKSDIPIIMLTARGELPDRVAGLEIGADDYLGKPFEPRELVARIQSLLRRERHRTPRQRLAFDGIEIDLERREVLRHGQPINLTGTKFELLRLLASEPKKVFSRDEILNRLRGTEAGI